MWEQTLQHDATYISLSLANHTILYHIIHVYYVWYIVSSLDHDLHTSSCSIQFIIDKFLFHEVG